MADGAKKDEQLKDQATQLTNLQRHRRAFSQYFYALTGYKGRVYSTFEGNVDDDAYWEFGGGARRRDGLHSPGPLQAAGARAGGDSRTRVASS